MICSLASVENISYKPACFIITDAESPAIEADKMYKQWESERECQPQNKNRVRESTRVVPSFTNNSNNSSHSNSEVPISQHNGEVITSYCRGLHTRFLQQKFASLSNIKAIREVQDSEGELTEREMETSRFNGNTQKNNSNGTLRDGWDAGKGVMSANEQVYVRRKSDGALWLHESEARFLSRKIRSDVIITEEQGLNSGDLNYHQPSPKNFEHSQVLNSPQRLRRASVECLLSSNSEISNRARTRSAGALLRGESRSSDPNGLDKTSETQSIDENENSNYFRNNLHRERRKSWQCYDINWNNMVARAKTYQTPLESNRTGLQTKFSKQSEHLESDVESNEISETSSIVSSLSSSSHNSSDSSQDELSPKAKGHAITVLAPTCNEADSDDSRNSSMRLSPVEKDLDNKQEEDFKTSTQIKQPTRRYSLASSPKLLSQKVSGYSTHGALEYAKELLGKLQDEGKTKSKKQRLDELSKALKWILEELNRIELPDRELVSLMTSLRMQIFSLKSELKIEESNEKSENLETSRRLLSQEKAVFVHSRRFSWC